MRTAQRWVSALRDGAEPTMTKGNEKKVEQAVRAGWQPRVRSRMRRAAEANGFQLSTMAQFGFASAAGSTDDPRLRTISRHISGEYARRLVAARDAGASERRQADILAEGLQEA
ncbi:hypothetical protein GCM10010440_56210 [Kitasatospora cinereorecta]